MHLLASLLHNCGQYEFRGLIVGYYMTIIYIGGPIPGFCGEGRKKWNLTFRTLHRVTWIDGI